MRAITVCVFLSLVAASNCYTAVPSRCCFDHQFEGYYGGSAASFQGGTVQGVNELLQFAYDFNGRRYGTEGNVQTTGGFSLNVKTIQLWTEGMEYTIVNDVCTAEPVVNGTEPIRCIPADAAFSSYMVEGKNELDLQVWQRTMSSADLNGTSTLSVSSNTCAPVGTSYIGSVNTGGGEHELLTSNGGYFNITSGVRDPKKWFGIPQSCRHANVKNQRDGVVGAITNLLRKISFLGP